MKVIKPGKFGHSWATEVTCSGWGNGGKGCEAILQVTRSDLRFFPGVSGESWGSKESAVSFECMCCGKLTDLGRDDWPAGYTDLVRWTKEWQSAAPESTLPESPIQRGSA